jgi:hypothetical protein
MSITLQRGAFYIADCCNIFDRDESAEVFELEEGKMCHLAKVCTVFDWKCDSVVELLF